MMNAIKARKIISFAIMVLLPTAFIYSQSDAQQIFESNKEAVFSLMALNENDDIVGEGTGFIVEPGVLATCYQLISRATSVTGKNYKGKSIKIDGVLGVDKNLNIVLLAVKGKAPAIALGNSDELDVGRKVFAIGTGESEEIEISEGEVTKLVEFNEKMKLIQISQDLYKNFSGAPLLDENGQVLGMVIFFERRLRITVPSNNLKAIQKQSLVKFKNWQPEDYLTTVDGAYFAGRVSDLLDETGRAQQYMERVKQARPDDIEVHSLLASIYDRQRNFERAIMSYEKVISIDSSRDKAYYGLGMVYVKMRQYERALPLLEKAIGLNPNYEDAYYYIGNSYQEANKFDKAAEAYAKYLEFKPENIWEVYYRMGVCYSELGQFEKATLAFEEAIKEKPQEVRIVYELAQSYEKSKQYDKAEETYKKISQLTPEDSIRPYRAILMMYDKAKMSDKAIEVAKEITNMEPNNYENFYNLGFMYQNAKKYNDAIEAFKKAMELNPGYEYAYSSVGYIYYQLENYAKAVEYYKKLVEIVPDNADYWFVLGVSYMQLKDFNSALEPLKTAVELRPNHAYALFNLGITYLNLHDNYSAREIYTKLRTIDPSLAQKLAEHIR